MLYNGEYDAADNADIQYDAQGNPIYDYYCNGTKVSSQAEYDYVHNQIYNVQQAVGPFDNAEYDINTGRYKGNGLCSYEDIIGAIIAY